MEPSLPSMASTPSVTLRRSLGSDAEAIHAIRSHPATRRFQPLVPGTRTELRRLLAERGSLPLNPGLAGKVQWTVVVDDSPAGWVSIDITSREHRIASIGYAIAPQLHGRGLASTSVAQVIPIVFDPDQLATERLEAVAAVDNMASRRVLERAGFAFEGIARGYLIIDNARVDHARYALLGR